MVWHIFKKDWKLLWVFVITVASLHWIATFVRFKLGLFGEDAMLEMLSQTVPELAFFGSMFLIAAIRQRSAPRFRVIAVHISRSLPPSLAFWT